MDPKLEGLEFPRGTEVYAAHGDKIGDVQHVGPDYVVVEKGIIFHKDLYVPKTAIASFDGEKLYLSVAKQDATLRGWEMKPTEAAQGDAAVRTTAPTIRDADTMLGEEQR
jgi:hypothetical protein